jgi:hypothetical protein
MTAKRPTWSLVLAPTEHTGNVVHHLSVHRGEL